MHHLENPCQAEEVLAALRACGNQTGFRIPRRDRRYRWSVTLRVLVEEQSGQGFRERELTVATGDISARGLGFYYDSYIHPGTLIRAEFNGLPSKPRLLAVVRHCTHVKGRRHRVGAEFIRVTRVQDMPKVRTNPRQ